MNTGLMKVVEDLVLNNLTIELKLNTNGIKDIPNDYILCYVNNVTGKEEGCVFFCLNKDFLTEEDRMIVYGRYNSSVCSEEQVLNFLQNFEGINFF